MGKTEPQGSCTYNKYRVPEIDRRTNVLLENVFVLLFSCCHLSDLVALLQQLFHAEFAIDVEMCDVPEISFQTRRRAVT